VSGDEGRLGELRRAFDSAFAAEPAALEERIDLIALRAAGRSYAVRIAEVSSVLAAGAVVPLPCEEPALLGLGAVRGTPIPVYDLAALLGDGAAKAPRWMVLSHGPDRLALAFDELEGYLRVPVADVAAAPPDPADRQASGELVRAGGSLRPVVSVASVVRRVKQRCGILAKER
jgi:chemotaxis signal transduction protein